MNRRQLVVCATLIGLAATGCAQVAPGGPTTPPGASATAAPGTATASGDPTGGVRVCQDLVAGLSLEQQAGELVMVGVTGSLDATESAAIRGSHLGSVILMGSAGLGMSGTQAITSAVRQLDGPTGILISVDQEGGRVQRLGGTGFTTIPPAAEQGTWSATELQTRAKSWGEELARAGVRLNLAPVADVVPADKQSTNEPIGKLGRGFAATPGEVATSVVAFIEGMDAAGVGSSVKHFPNLGQVTGNTDFSAGVVDDVTTAHDPALEPYRAAIAHGTASVMISTAIYTRIDPDNMAAFSSKVIGILRDDLGYTGVVVSDDLSAAQSVKSVAVAERGVRFVRAGGDLAISVGVSDAKAMAAGIVAEAEKDPAFRARVAESAERVVEMKSTLGVASCEAVVG